MESLTNSEEELLANMMWISNYGYVSTSERSTSLDYSENLKYYKNHSIDFYNSNF